MQLNVPYIEYELVSIDWMLPYELSDTNDVSCVCEESISTGRTTEETEKHNIECDADGVPMGNSLEEIRMREKLIDNFFRNWYSEHSSKEVFNTRMNENILVRKISIDEAKEHAAKRYKSTIAVLRHFDEILANASSIGKTAVKIGDRNQSRFDYMMIMSYLCADIGTIKLTVGIRKKSDGDNKYITMTQYGISALEEGQSIVVPRKSDKKKKKKASR